MGKKSMRSIYRPCFTLYSSVKVSFDVRAVTCRLCTLATSSASVVSSWKWVANKQKPQIFVAMYLIV